MGKKRKAGGQPYGERGYDDAAQSSKLTINTYEDVADSEDEFHLSRDKILLDEGPQAKRLRKLRQEDEFLQPSDEEVLAYSDASEDEELEEDEQEEDFGEEEDISDDDLGLGKKNRNEEEDDELEGWGSSKKDYYNADAIETEQDALDEEAEALRLQQKHLQGMTEADYGFDESEWVGQDGEEEGTAGDEAGDVVTEVLPELQITDDIGSEERLKLLRTRYPEFDYLAKEFLRLQPLHNELAHAANAAAKLAQKRVARSSQNNGSTTQTPVAVVKHQALAAYLAAIAMYFALLTSTATENGAKTIAMAPAELRDHSVIEGLLRCQQLWAKVEHLQIADPMVDLANGDGLSSIEEESAHADSGAVIELPQAKTGRKVKQTKAQRAAEVARAEAEARRAEKIRQTEEELAGLASLTDKSALRKATKSKKAREPAAVVAANADDSDFGEEMPLTAQELAEKARKKKSLRFYTSQIAQKANKRDAAGRDYGGDADIPHRERLKDRQARLQAEAEKRGRSKQGPGDELGGDSEPEDHQHGGGSQSNDDDDYYDLVAARSKQKKQAKQDLADAYSRAAAEGGQVILNEEMGADGKRAISYTILKNKGLTPHRKKEVRNPRLKKKLKYEAKKRKLASTKSVFRGGEGRGGYSGELTGIKKGLVKSVKL